MLSTTILAISSRTSTVALPRCGHTTFFILSRRHLGLVLEHVEAGAGDRALASARISAASSTTAPRAVLIRKALGFIARARGADLMARFRLKRRMERNKIGLREKQASGT